MLLCETHLLVVNKRNGFRLPYAAGSRCVVVQRSYASLASVSLIRFMASTMFSSLVA